MSLVPVYDDRGYLVKMEKPKRCPTCHQPIGDALETCPKGALKLPLELPKRREPRRG